MKVGNNKAQRTRGNLQNDDSGNETDTETGNETASNHDVKSGRGSFKNTANGEDNAAKNDSHTTANEVGKVTGNDSAEESTSRQNRGSKGLLPGGDAEEGLAVVDNEWVLGIEARELYVRVFIASVLIDEEVLKFQVVSEEFCLENGVGGSPFSRHLPSIQYRSQRRYHRRLRKPR